MLVAAQKLTNWAMCVPDNVNMVDRTGTEQTAFVVRIKFGARKFVDYGTVACFHSSTMKERTLHSCRDNVEFGQTSFPTLSKDYVYQKIITVEASKNENIKN